MSSLEQLLSLFDLTIPFNERDLKVAKKKVLMLNPDKNRNIPNIKNHYIKYLEAYQKLELIFNHTKHGTNEEQLKQQQYIDTTFKEFIEKK